MVIQIKYRCEPQNKEGISSKSVPVGALFFVREVLPETKVMVSGVPKVSVESQVMVSESRKCRSSLK